jgi:hypothetical protein
MTTTTAQPVTKEENRTRELPFSILCPPSPVVPSANHSSPIRSIRDGFDVRERACKPLD